MEVQLDSSKKEITVIRIVFKLLFKIVKEANQLKIKN